MFLFKKGNGFAGPGGKLIVNLYEEPTNFEKSNKKDLFELSDLIFLNGGREINNTEGGDPCRLGASGAMCVISHDKKKDVLIDGRDINTNNPLLFDINEMSGIDNIKIMRNSYVSYLQSINGVFPNIIKINSTLRIHWISLCRSE